MRPRKKFLAAHGKDLIARLKNGGTISTEDFKGLGYGFEGFLRYGGLNEANTEKFHAHMVKILEPVVTGLVGE